MRISDWSSDVCSSDLMVFGNMGDDCATGVAFTRNPSTGEKAFYGEYLVNAQGEDVVAGICTPQNLTLRGKAMNNSRMPAMDEVTPEELKYLDPVSHKPATQEKAIDQKSARLGTRVTERVWNGGRGME